MSSNASNRGGDIALSVRDLSKRYRIAQNQERHRTITDAIMHRVRRPLERPLFEDFWALRDVSFDVKRGDVVGIIGRNGAGKSTLLKMLSRITKPTTGEIRLFGRVGSLLEVGTGFHPELTGRENIYLNGSILGMRRQEIDRQFDAIVDFSGTEKFLDTPVKRYSSGMYVRLAFAVAAHLNPEILIIDEVLAVGDAEFQKKCLGKMQSVSREEGCTVLFVSHNMAAIRQLCRSAILLSQGQLSLYGTPGEITIEYLRPKDPVNLKLTSAVQAPNKYGLRLVDVALITDDDDLLRTDMPLFGHDYRLYIEIEASTSFRNAAIVVKIMDDMGTLISSMCSPEEGLNPFEIAGNIRIAFAVPQLRLLPGRYSISVYVFRPNDSTEFLSAEDILRLEVHQSVVGHGMWPYRKEHGLARISGGVEIEFDRQLIKSSNQL